MALLSDTPAPRLAFRHEEDEHDEFLEAITAAARDPRGGDHKDIVRHLHVSKKTILSREGRAEYKVLLVKSLLGLAEDYRAGIKQEAVDVWAQAALGKLETDVAIRFLHSCDSNIPQNQTHSDVFVLLMTACSNGCDTPGETADPVDLTHQGSWNTSRTASNKPFDLSMSLDSMSVQVKSQVGSGSRSVRPANGHRRQSSHSAASNHSLSLDSVPEEQTDNEGS